MICRAKALSGQFQPSSGTSARVLGYYCINNNESNKLMYIPVFSFYLIACISSGILYSEKAWACAQDGIPQRGRLADGDMTTSPSPSCLLPLWTHVKCFLAFMSYFPMWIEATHTFIKTVCSTRSYKGPYMQAKYADFCYGVLFRTACTRCPHVLSLSSRCEKFRFMAAIGVS